MPTDQELQHLLLGVIATALYALPWILGGLGGIALLSYGPIGKALRRLARSRDEETALLTATAASIAEMREVLEQIAERQDFMERALTQSVRPQPLPRASREITPH
jgi:hypothetical protein